MVTDECGTDCKAIQREGLQTMTRQMQSLVWGRKLMQTCDQCGHSDPAGGFCNECGHYPSTATFWDQRSKVSNAQKQSRKAGSKALEAHRASSDGGSDGN
jgi:ribosomal protein L32